MVTLAAVGTGGSAGQKNRRTRRRTAEVESRAREGLKVGEGLEGI